MSGHLIGRGRLVGVRSVTDGICAPAVTDALLTIATDGDERDLSVTPDVAAAIAAAGLLFADVELTLTRTDEPAPAVDERRRYLAELDRSTRLERALADAEATVRDLRALAAANDVAVRAHRAVADAASLDLRAAIGREIAHAAFVAQCSESDAIRGAMSHVAERLRAVVDPQPPHGGSTDVERVVVGEGVVDVSFGAGRVWYPHPDGSPGHYLTLTHDIVGLRAHEGRRARVVVELLPDVEPVDAAERVGEERGEGVGAVDGGQHVESIASAPATVQSRGTGAA